MSEENQTKQRLIKQSPSNKGLDVETLKSSMSVPEMRALLGLGKTDSYWLIHREHFETRTVAGHYRVMIDSFEEWYRNQFHYKKVNGELPGQALSHLISIPEAAKLMGIAERDLYAYMNRCFVIPFKVELINGVKKIEKKSFVKWMKATPQKRGGGNV